MVNTFTEEELLPWQVFRQEVPLYVTHSHSDPHTVTLYKLDSLTNTVLFHGCTLTHQMLAYRQESELTQL